MGTGSSVGSYFPSAKHLQSQVSQLSLALLAHLAISHSPTPNRVQRLAIQTKSSESQSNPVRTLQWLKSAFYTRRCPLQMEAAQGGKLLCSPASQVKMAPTLQSFFWKRVMRFTESFGEVPPSTLAESLTFMTTQKLINRVR